MIFIIPLILGIGKALEAVIGVADEAVIRQAHPTMQEVVRHKKQVFDRPISLPIPLCERVGIASEADERDDDMCEMLFFVTFTDEETSQFDRMLRKCAGEQRTREDYFSLRRVLKTGQERFRYTSNKMNEAGWGAQKK